MTRDTIILFTLFGLYYFLSQKYKFDLKIKNAFRIFILPAFLLTVYIILFKL